MKFYIGTKVVEAAPMTRDEFQNTRNRYVGGTETGEGYLVRYDNGYESWSPKHVFEEAYRRINNMTYGLALEALKRGHTVTNLDWPQEGMFLFLVPGSVFSVNRAPLNKILAKGTLVNYLSHIDLRNADGSIGPYIPSQADMLGENWVLIS
jgi:hypothetical protein